ncbi:response regulator [Paenibacillus sp. M1]|uniref:Response regulator n=1 Tax=Paenibacillus haidiansis TaxID=1574488 RepID=A0ABU7VSP7_9BACL
MYNVMIVEDSKPILRNIKTLLDSMDLPIRIAATATNGEEALDMLRRQPINLLLTDIRMPKMDGLALIEQAKLISPQLKFVLISGYSDFEYTRKALNLQVFDYLLKPVDRSQLAEVMDRAIDQLNRQTPNDAELLREIVDPDFYAEQSLGEEFHHYAKMMLIVRKQPFTVGPWSLQEVEQRLADRFAPHRCWVFPANRPEQFLALVNRAAVDSFSSLYECLESVRRHLHAHGLAAIVGGQPPSPESGRLPEMYHRLSGIVDQQQRIAEGFAVVDTGVPTSRPESAGGSIDAYTADTFAELIRGRRKEQFTLKLTEHLAKWADGNVRVAELERFVGLVAGTFAQMYAERGSDIRPGLEAKAKELFEEKSYADFSRELLEWTKQCFDMLHAHSRKSGEELFGQMDEFVRMNMYSQLSINDIALKFHVSPSYISRIIKRYTESTFVQYYTGLKIKEACRLMESKPDMKFKELSDLLSFSDQHYFSKVFKEYTGFSPTEYKEQVLAKRPEANKESEA